MLKTSNRTVRQAPHPLLTGVAAGLIAGGVTGQVDQFLSRFVSEKQKKADRRVRPAPAHEMAGPYFARKITGKKMNPQREKRAKATFGVAYGLLWGLVYSGIRRKVPQTSRFAGLPFGIPFFFACDGLLAPLFGVTPNLKKIPWQINAKELGNHLAWTATSEMVHRGVARASERKHAK